MSDTQRDINADIAAMPRPSSTEVAKRSNIVVQCVRFVVLNLKILKLSRQHH